MTTKIAYLLAVVLALFALNLAQLRAECIIFTTDGVIEDGDIYECVQILNDATVNMTGGTVTDYIALTDQSTLNLNAGSVSTIEPNDRSTVNINGGNVMRIRAYGSSTLNITNGLVEWFLATYDSATLTLSGGSIHSISAYDSSTVNITRGEIGDIWASDSSTVNIGGGELAYICAYDFSTVNIIGGSIHHWLDAFDSSLVNIYDVDMINADLSVRRQSTLNIYGGNMSFDKAVIDSQAPVNVFGGNISFDSTHIAYDSCINVLGGNITFDHPDVYCDPEWSPFTIYGYDFNYDPNSRLFTASLLYTGQITLNRFWPDDYECLNLVVAPLAVVEIVQVLLDKNQALHILDQMFQAESTAYNDLEELLQTGDYGDLTKPEIVKAKQKLHSAIQHEHQSKAALEKSIDNLNDALDALNWYSPPYEPPQH